jgi:cyclopropane fatty-acyl-phospholipid synthase-like methyltransferase
MPSHSKRVVDYFDQTSDDYRFLWGTDRHLGLHCGYFDRPHLGHDDAVLNMNRVLATLASIRPGQRVLDAGCGIGGSAIWLAEHVGAQVVGFNINAKQLDQASRLAHTRNLQGRVQFQVGDYCATQLQGESFDVVWALESACYADDKKRFLTEAHRLLKPGGRLIVADGFLSRDDLSPDERRLVECWQCGWAIPNVASIDQFGSYLRDLGFRTIFFRDVTQQIVPSSRRIYRASLMFYPLGLLLYWIGLRTRIQTLGIASGYYQYKARRRGLGVYGFFLAEK